MDGKADDDHTHNYLPLSGGTLSGEIVLENFDNYFLARKGRTISDGTTHFITVGVAATGGSTIEHYTCSTTNMFTSSYDGRIELTAYKLISNVPVVYNSLNLNSYLSEFICRGMSAGTGSAPSTMINGNMYIRYS